MSSTTTDATHVDVLIIGAGPAGLMAGIALARAGVKIKIVDQKYVPRLFCTHRSFKMF